VPARCASAMDEAGRARFLGQGSRVVGSALALAAAYILTATPHELVHGLAAAGFGLDPVWHGDRAPHRPGSAVQETVVAGAAPIYSVLSGAVVLVVARRFRGYAGLLSTWFGLLGVAGFCGYLVSGPLARTGDVPDVLRLLGGPTWVGWCGLLLGVGGLLVTAKVAAIRVSALAPPTWSPTRALLVLGVLAVPLAAGLVLLAGVPVRPPFVAQLVALLVTLLVGLAFSRLRPPVRCVDPGLWPARLDVPVGVLLLLAVVEWLVLRPGVPL
jgi:hypothetical protein